jgi:ATP-dependent Clp protease protease subunit
MYINMEAMGMISQLNEQLRRIVLSGTIREDSAAQFLEQITAFEYVDITKPITVYIDTFGGSVDAALLMYDAIKSCACPVVTVGIGKVMSAGVLLLAAGERGTRFITENTRVMLHEVAGGAFGPISEMEVSIAETRRLQEIYLELLAKDTGQSKQKIQKDIVKDFYMSAAEAVKYGIADKVVPTRKQLKKLIMKDPVKKETPKKSK